MKYKFKLGQKVRIVDHIKFTENSNIWDAIGWCDPMVNAAGEIGEIVEIGKEMYYISFADDELNFWYAPEVIRPLKKKKIL